MSPAPITDQPGLLGAGLLKAVAQLPGGLEEYVDSDGVVPNVFIWAAFLVTSPLGAVEETTFHEEHPLQRFFDTCAFDESTKQLEICAAHFDIFRAQNELPVVHGSMSVCFPTGWHEGRLEDLTKISRFRQP
jgi:hypothetical protein